MAEQTVEQTQAKYRSRKFIVTVGGMGLAAVMVYFGSLTPEMSNIILAAIGSYNIANAFSRNG
mgnify:CR=1 FL=1